MLISVAGPQLPTCPSQCTPRVDVTLNDLPIPPVASTTAGA